jgi:hypothetical protein
MFKKEEALKAILSSIKKPEAKEKSESEYKSPEERAEEGEDEGLVAAAEDVLSAIESKDAAALASAIKSLVSMC